MRHSMMAKWRERTLYSVGGGRLTFERFGSDLGVTNPLRGFVIFDFFFLITETFEYLQADRKS